MRLVRSKAQHATKFSDPLEFTTREVSVKDPIGFIFSEPLAIVHFKEPYYVLP